MARKSRKMVENEPTTQPPSFQYIRTAIYIRLSVEDNGGKGNSLETQQLIIEDFLAGHPDMNVIETYTDNGATGTNFDRPGFLKMLADIEAGKIDCIIVKDLSRLGRNSIDAGFYIERYFPDHKVRFISVNDNYDSEHSDSLHGGIIIPLKNMINEAYALDISKKVKAQQRQAMKNGEYVGGRAPYGYIKDPKNCHKLLVDEEAATVVRQIFSWAAEKASLDTIVVRLNDAGILPPSQYKKAQGIIKHDNLLGSGKWQTRTVLKILESEVYVGDLVQGKTKSINHKQMPADPSEWIIVRDTHAAIISRELFEIVENHREQTLKKIKSMLHKPYKENIFKGKVFCGCCGKYMHYQRNERKKQDVYRFCCDSRHRISTGICDNLSITENELAGRVLDSLREQVRERLDTLMSSAQGLTLLEEKSAEVKRKISAIKSQSEQSELFLKHLYENLIQGILTSEEYFAMKQKYTAELESSATQIINLEDAVKKLHAEYKKTQSLEQNAEALNSASLLNRNVIVELIDRIIIGPDKKVEVIIYDQGGGGEICENM